MELPRPVKITLIGAVLCVLLTTASLTRCPMLYFYDEGVYYLAAVEIAEGGRPYTDFYLAHPPGVAWLNCLIVKCGGGLESCRAVAFSLSIIAIFVLMKIASGIVDVTGHQSAARWLAAIFLATTQLYVLISSQVLTQMPEMCITTIGFLYLLPARRSPLLSGTLLAVASLFRVQAALMGPAWAIFLLVAYGCRDGWRPVVQLTVSCMTVAVLLHGGVALTYDNYFNCIVGSHLTRPPTGFGDKFDVLNRIFVEPQLGFGLLSAVILASTGPGLSRGIGWCALVAVSMAFLANRFLYPGYFLQTFPYLCCCSSVLICRIAASYGDWRPCLATAIAVLVLSGVPIARQAIYRWTTQRAFEHDLIERVRAVPGGTLACTTGKVALYAGKRLTRDYLCPDTTSPISHDFGNWFVELSRRSDAVFINDVVVGRLSPEQARAIKLLNLPLIFGTSEDEATFRSTASVK